MSNTFPFGQPIIPVRQLNNGQPKKLFILGVYASAVHVKWIGPNGKTRIRAMAVASEPEIFWRGDAEYVKKVIADINLDPKYGHLEPADQAFNGPSGKCLDDNYIHPLGLTRKDVWLCDLLPESRKNPSQEEALRKNYDGYVNIPYKFPPVPKPIADEQRVDEIVKELEASGSQKIILLGDEPIKYFINHFDKPINFDKPIKKLSDIKPYGKEIKVPINGKNYNVICLAHPRQTAKLGKSSEKWYDVHHTWIKEIERKGIL